MYKNQNLGKILKTVFGITKVHLSRIHHMNFIRPWRALHFKTFQCLAKGCVQWFTIMYQKHVSQIHSYSASLKMKRIETFFFYKSDITWCNIASHDNTPSSSCTNFYAIPHTRNLLETLFTTMQWFEAET